MLLMAENPTAEHEIRIRMLGNSSVYVTCKCLDKVRAKPVMRTTRGEYYRPRRQGAPEWKSLGDFPVGTPIAQLLAAYTAHLEDK